MWEPADEVKKVYVDVSQRHRFTRHNTQKGIRHQG